MIQPIFGLAVWSLISLFLSSSFFQSLTPSAKLFTYISFFCWVRFYWKAWHKKLFSAGVLLAGLIQISFILFQMLHGRPRFGFYQANPNYAALHLSLCALLCLAQGAVRCGEKVAGVGFPPRAPGNPNGSPIRPKAEWSPFRRGMKPTPATFSPGAIIVLWLIGSLLFTVGVVITYSRSAVLGLLAGTGWLVFKRFRWRGLLLFTCGMVIIIALLPGASLSKVIKSDDPYLSGRLLLWRTSLKLIQEHPFTGAGLGNFEDAMLTQQIPFEGALSRYGRMSPFSHNDYLQVGSELGLPALAMCVWALFLLLRNKAIKDDPNGSMACIVCVLVIALFDFPFYLLPNAIIIMGLAGTLGVPDENVDGFLKPFVIMVTVLAVSIWSLAVFVGNIPKNPDDPFAWARLGGIAAERNDFKTAFKAYDKALELNPFHAPWLVERGYLHLGLGEFIPARADFCQAIRLEPNDITAHQAIVKSFSIEGMPDVARKYENYVIKFRENIIRRINAGQLLYNGSNYENDLLGLVK